MRAHRLVGKTIARVVQVRCSEGRHREHEADAIVFTDGSVLRFNVVEHESQDYGVRLIYPGRAVPALRGED